MISVHVRNTNASLRLRIFFKFKRYGNETEKSRTATLLFWQGKGLEGGTKRALRQENGRWEHSTRCGNLLVWSTLELYATAVDRSQGTCNYQSLHVCVCNVLPFGYVVQHRISCCRLILLVTG